MTTTLTDLEQAMHEAGLVLDDHTLELLAMSAARTLAARARPLPVYGPCDRCGQVPRVKDCRPIRGERRGKDDPVPLTGGLCPNCAPEETSDDHH